MCTAQVCNAGVLWATRVLDITPAEWKATMDVNLDGVFYCAHRGSKAAVGAVLHASGLQRD